MIVLYQQIPISKHEKITPYWIVKPGHFYNIEDDTYVGLTTFELAPNNVIVITKEELINRNILSHQKKPWVVPEENNIKFLTEDDVIQMTLKFLEEE